MLASTDQFNSSTILRNAEGTMRWLSLHHTRMAQISCFEFLPSREVRQISNSDQAFHFPELWRSECPSDASHSKKTAWFLTHTFTFHQFQACQIDKPKLPCPCQAHVVLELRNDMSSYPWKIGVKFFELLTSKVTLPGHRLDINSQVLILATADI